MSKLLFLFVFFILLAPVSLWGDTFEYADMSHEEVNERFKLISLDNEKAVFEMEQKGEFFEYALQYNLGKYGDNEDDILSYIYNENHYGLVLSSCIHLYDNLWITFDIDYNDSFRKNMNSFDRLINENENSQYKSEIRLFFQPNSFTTANIGLENINNNTDGDWSDYQSFSDNSDRKISFNINTDLSFFKIDAKFYQTDKVYDYFYRDFGDYRYFEESDYVYRGIEAALSKEIFSSLLVELSMFKMNKYYNYKNKNVDLYSYFNSIAEIQKGVMISLSKTIFDRIKLVTTGEVADFKILDSSQSELIGNEPTYSPKKQADVSLEYFLNDIKFISKLTHVGERYSDSYNNSKLDSYTIVSIGATYNTRLNDNDMKIDFNVKNALDNDYLLYSDTKGDPRSYYMNVTMQF